MKASCAVVLAKLLEKRPQFTTAKELAELGSFDYRKRLSELRRMGYVIERRSIPGRPYSEWRIVMEAQ